VYIPLQYNQPKGFRKSIHSLFEVEAAELAKQKFGRTRMESTQLTAQIHVQVWASENIFCLPKSSKNRESP